MAEAIARSLDPKQTMLIDSCGVHPGSVLDSGARSFLEKRGFDLSGQGCKGFREVLPLEDYSAIVTVCPQEYVQLPQLPSAVRVEHWNTSDPTGHMGAGREKAYQNLHDDLKARIEKLFAVLRKS